MHINSLALELLISMFEMIPKGKHYSATLSMPTRCCRNAPCQCIQAAVNMHEWRRHAEHTYEVFDQLIKTLKPLAVLKLDDISNKFTWFSDEYLRVDPEAVNRHELLGRTLEYLQKRLRILDSRDRTVNDHVR
jgi:hypothetical protein